MDMGLIEQNNVYCVQSPQWALRVASSRPAFSEVIWSSQYVSSQQENKQRNSLGEMDVGWCGFRKGVYCPRRR